MEVISHALNAVIITCLDKRGQYIAVFLGLREQPGFSISGLDNIYSPVETKRQT